MATIKQKKAFKAVVENGGNVSKAMEQVGYSPATAHTPQKLTDTRGWKELVEEYLPDSLLATKHKGLLDLSGISHMVFPTAMTDDEIRDLIRANGCEVKKIKHGDMATHVWYFAPDGNAIKAGLDMAYKIKGAYKEDNLQKKFDPIIVKFTK